MKNFLVLIFSLLCLAANAQAPLSISAYKAKVNTQVRTASGATSITKEIIAGLYDDLANIVAIKADTATLVTLVEWTDTVGGMIVTGYKLDTFKINIRAALAAHTANVSNPHSVTKTQVGLGNADNTSDLDKPISTLTQAAITAHTSNVSNPHSVTKTQVGLGNADNTSDLDKPVSAATRAEIADTAEAIRADMSGGGVSTDSLYLGTMQQAITDSVFAWGNSITAGFGLAAVQDRWLNIVADYFGLTAVNNAVSGTTLMKQVPIDLYASPNMMDNLASIPVKRPGIKLLICAYGLNDVRINSPAYDTANFRAAYKRYLDSCIARGHTGSGILLATPSYVTPTSYVSLGYGAATQARHLSFNYVVQTLAAEYGTYFADVYTHLAYYGGGENMLDDSVHLNKDGNKRYAQKIISVLKYPVEKQGQKIAAHGAAAFDSLYFRGGDTAVGDVTLLAVDKSGKVVRVPNSFIRNNSGAEKQGASGNINGNFTANRVTATEWLAGKNFTASGNYAATPVFPGLSTGWFAGNYIIQPEITAGVYRGIQIPFVTGTGLILGQTDDDGINMSQNFGTTRTKGLAVSAIVSTSGTAYGLTNTNASILLCDATSNAVEVIPPVTGITIGREYTIIKTAGGNAVTINPASGATIAGAADYTVTSSATIIFDGTNYQVKCAH